MRNAVYLLGILLLALGLYAYEVRKENVSLERTVHAQYMNELSSASEMLTNLQRSVSQSLLFQDEDALNKELDNIWRLSDQLRSSISSLPLSSEVTTQWLRYVGNIGDLAKEASTRKTYEEWQKRMGKVNDNLLALEEEWNVATSQLYENEGDFSVWKKMVKEDLEQSSFKNVSANLKSFTETDFPLTASESDYKKKIELKHIKDKEITKDEAIAKLEKLLPNLKDAEYVVSKSKDDAPYPFYHIQFVKGTRVGYADITQKGGHIISFLSERKVQPKNNVSREKVRKRAKQFLDTAGYTDLKLVEERENHDAWYLSYARVAGKYKALVYPDGVQLKVSKESGELLGFNAMEYIQKEKIKDQKVNPINWKQFFRKGTNIENEQMIYTENEALQLRLCYEVIATLNNNQHDTYRVVVDAENHDVLKVEYLP